MGSYNGDTVYVELKQKIKAKEDLTDTDLMNLIFLPLMKHTIPKNELAAKSIKLAQTIDDRTKRDVCIASIVAFASKYLNDFEKKKLLEVIKMTDLATMLMEEGKIEKSIEIAKNALLRGLNVDDIMAITGLDKLKVKQLQEEIQH